MTSLAIAASFLISFPISMRPLIHSALLSMPRTDLQPMIQMCCRLLNTQVCVLMGSYPEAMTTHSCYSCKICRALSQQADPEPLCDQLLISDSGLTGQPTMPDLLSQDSQPRASLLSARRIKPALEDGMPSRALFCLIEGRTLCSLQPTRNIERGLEATHKGNSNTARHQMHLLADSPSTLQRFLRGHLEQGIVDIAVRAAQTTVELIVFKAKAIHQCNSIWPQLHQQLMLLLLQCPRLHQANISSLSDFFGTES